MSTKLDNISLISYVETQLSGLQVNLILCKILFSSLRPGDQVVVKGYIAGEDFYHHGIFVDDGIIDFGAGTNGEVRKVSIKEFTAGRRLERVLYSDNNCLPPSTVIKNAYEYLRNPSSCGFYDIVKNNCEHFATKCKTGFACSKQLWNKLAGCIFNPLKMLKYAIGGALMSAFGGLSNMGGSTNSFGSRSLSGTGRSSDSYGSSSLSGISGSSALCGKSSY